MSEPTIEDYYHEERTFQPSAEFVAAANAGDRSLYDEANTDLAGFWAGTWGEVRRELRGRYPKHDWPEHPATAKPRRR